jgi:hypothetical protein
VTPGNYDVLVLNNIATLIPIKHSDLDAEDPIVVNGAKANWKKLLDLYPGQFRANLSQLRLTKSDGNEVVAYISLDPFDERRMILNIDTDTIPTNSTISGRGTVDAVVNPETFSPNSPVSGTRYLILENISAISGIGPAAWLNGNGSAFTANANDIIQWDGSAWSVVFNSQEVNVVTYITNIYTGIHYKWDGEAWSKTFEGIYEKDAWRIIL